MEPDSAAWRIHREPALLLGWGRAVLLQLAHPLVAAAVAEHSGFATGAGAYRHRLGRTLAAMLALTFGTPEETAQAARSINAVHARVRGRLGEPGGAWPAGAPYSAEDPTLLRWVHATLADSFLRTYELYVGGLSPEAQDRYCAEVSRVAPLLGLPGELVPASARGLRRYVDSMLASGDVAVTGVARSLAREVLSPPAPPAAWPLLHLFRLTTAGLLPPAIRRDYGLAWDRRRAAELALVAGLVRRLQPTLPAPARHWPAARAAEQRARPGAPAPRKNLAGTMARPPGSELNGLRACLAHPHHRDFADTP